MYNNSYNVILFRRKLQATLAQDLHAAGTHRHVDNLLALCQEKTSKAH